MAFTITDFHDLVRLLEQHEEWRKELCRLLLTDGLSNPLQAQAEQVTPQPWALEAQGVSQICRTRLGMKCGTTGRPRRAEARWRIFPLNDPERDEP